MSSSFEGIATLVSSHKELVLAYFMVINFSKFYSSGELRLAHGLANVNDDVQIITKSCEFI